MLRAQSWYKDLLINNVLQRITTSKYEKIMWVANSRESNIKLAMCKYALWQEDANFLQCLTLTLIDLSLHMMVKLETFVV